LSTTEEKCASLQQAYTEQINDVQSRIQKSGVELTDAIKRKNEHSFTMHMKQTEMESVMSDFHVHMHECETNLAKTHEEICGLESMRAELVAIESAVKNLQDCEVSDWVMSGCSATCGGGERIKTRQILIPANGGSKCPPLEEREVCGNDPCPINCVMDEWQEWTSCSTECGGGFHGRSRLILVPDQHGGEPCSATQTSVTCNPQPCDRDCELSEWQDWGGCTKACGGGFQHRVKKVAVPAKGTGQCPPHRQKNRGISQMQHQRMRRQGREVQLQN